MSEPGTETELHRLLEDRGETLATAESLTGGQLAALLTSVPGSSAWFVGGVVSYATDLKLRLLEVPPDVVDGVGVVSAECAAAMAVGVRRLCRSTYGVATTGVAGPAEQEGKPVGTVYIGVAGPDGAQAHRLSLDGSRGEIQDATCRRAVDFLTGFVGREDTPVG